jgi:hypothetical protein
LIVLITSVLIGGFIFNAQFSTEQAVSLLSLAVPLSTFAGVFILTVGVPLLALLFGNIYCGYLCPFGAMQELIGYILPARLRPVLSKGLMRKARFAKYVIAFVIISAFFLTRHHDTLAIDPLIGAFNFRAILKSTDTLLLLVVGVALIGSIFYSRLWCRYLCPAGAVLSLFNKIALFRRYLPAKHYAKCEYGLSYNDKTDCIYCDKCRFEPKPAVEPVRFRYFLAAVVIIAVGLCAVTIRNFAGALPSPSHIAAATSAGQIRNVDLQKVRKMIQQNQLSDREADFYKKSE